MTLAGRIGAGLAAAVANCGLMLAPVLALRGTLQVTEIAAVTGLSLAVASEVICADSPPPPSDGDLDGLNWAQGLALLAGFQFALLWGVHTTWLLSGLLGALTMLTGAVLRGLAIRRLGGGFTNGSRPATAGLCTDGVYTWLRHPAETGLLLIAAGFSVIIGAWQAMSFVLPVLVILSALRIRREDQSLARAFPGAFDLYRDRVRF